MKNSIIRSLRDFVDSIPRREEGQTMAEYGVVLAVITVATVAAFTALSGGIAATIDRVKGFLPV
jgi:Flp pilus assembly pilin Flp